VPSLALAKSRPNHPPIAALRDRLLQHYHGLAANVFTNVPGFGALRVRPSTV
jgi:hypothetical protein